VILSLLSADATAQQSGVQLRNKTTNTPRSIKLPENSKYRTSDAQAIFREYLDINPATDQMVFHHTTNSKMGVSVDRYFQYYKGIKIDRSSYVVYSKNGIVQYLSGNFYKTDPNAPTVPAISEGQALVKALDFVHAEKYKWQYPEYEAGLKKFTKNPDTTWYPKGQLVYVEDMQSINRDGKLHLAYSFDIHAQKPMSRDIIYVDAITGNVLHKNPMIKHVAATGASLYSATVPIQTVLNGPVYNLHDLTRGNGVYTFDMQGSDGDQWTDAVEFENPVLNWLTADAGIDVHWGSAMVYDYWNTQQGRLSFDNANAEIYSFVHYDINYDNAFWNGSVMTYGDGNNFDPLVCLDVVAHEIGHAVCQYEPNLDYEAESGALNEGFSDIWGAVIENWANPNEVDAEPKSTWRLAEEISSTEMRSFLNPNSHNQPDTYLGDDWYDINPPCIGGSGGNDNCGVHYNSGVINRWFYILSMGDAGTNDNNDAYSVTGIGITQAALIAYNAEILLFPNAEYADARAAAIAASTALYGACSPQTQAVTDAWYAVGVGQAFVPCFPTVGFASATTSVTEWNNTIVCPSSRTVNIPVSVTAAPTGGNATITVTVIGGTAVAGQDYTLTTSNLTFNAGSTTPQNAVLTIFDNGAINDNKYVTLQLTLTPNGSNLALNTLLDTIHVDITNQDNAPVAATTVTHDVLNNTTTSNGGSPWQSSNRNMRSQILVTAAELAAGGMVIGQPISALAFNVQTKNSTQPYNGFTVSIAHTLLNTLAIGTFQTTGFTQVYSGNYSTTGPGWNTIPFQTNFVWTGGNIIINTCFSNTTNIAANDILLAQNNPTLNVYSKNTTTPAGCALTASNNNSPARPIMRFTQVVPGTAIETTNASTRIWDVRNNTEVYFYSTADSQAIAGIRNMNNNLGCVSATLTGAGTGFTPAAFGGVNRSLKEFTITPTINGSTTTYAGRVYMTPTELNGATPANLFLVKTNEATDATINAGNSVIVTPTVSANASWTSFEGNFTGFGRFFLTDGPLPPPVPVITPGGPTTFCAGSSVILNGNTGSGLSYSWLLNGVLISGATASSFTASASGTYNFIMTNSAGVADTSAGVTVTVNPGPPAITTPTGNTSICNGNSLTINANTGSGYTYQWLLNGANITGATSSSITVSAGGIYNVQVTAAGCATMSANINLTINPLPIANAGNDFTVCTGSTLNLTAQTVAGVTYSWDGPNSFSSNVQNPSIPNAQAINQGTYTLTVTNTLTNCVNTDQVFVNTTLGNAPGQPNDMSGPSPVCSGTTQTYSVPPVAGATSYTWTLPNGWTGTSTTNSIDATPNINSGTILVTANNACGAGPAQSMAVSINATPNTPFVVGNVVYCVGETPAQLSATGTNLMWYNTLTGGVGSSVAPTPSTATPGQTAYYVSQNNGTCESQRSIILVNINALPVVNVSVAGTTLTADGSYPFYQWYLDGVLIPGANTNIYVATQNGVYTVEVSDMNGCVDISDPETISSFPVSVTNSIVKEPKFYPNPTTGICWLELPQTSAKTDILITDAAGKVIHKATVKDQSKLSFDLSKAAKGVYMVKVVTANKTYTSRVTLQ
jgi:Zn-dependent metalloprotease